MTDFFSRQTRRQFLATQGAALTALAGWTPLASAMTRTAVKHTDRHATANLWLRDPIDPALLRQLAAHAMDAAKQAGATYADIRLSARRELRVSAGDEERGAINYFAPGGGELVTFSAYGVRAMVDGAWAFVNGATFTPDAVAEAARRAVADARAYAEARVAGPTAAAEWTAASAVTGSWETPMQVDPFAAPLHDHYDLLGAFMQAANRSVRIHTYIHVSWKDEQRVFASTEGSVISQRWHRVIPIGTVSLGDPWVSPAVTIRQLDGQSGGMEMLAIPIIQDHIKAAAEDARMVGLLPERPFDVGRYPAVFDGRAMGMMLGSTLNMGLELERALGYNPDGVTILSPPEDFLGAQFAAPMVSVMSDPTLPALSTSKWDDEGALTRPFPVIRDGRIMTYFTTRVNAPLLRARAAKASHGITLPEQGSAIAWDVTEPPMGCGGHLTMSEGTSNASLDDLCREISRGVLIRAASNVIFDQSVSGGILRRGTVMLAIERGAVTHRVGGAALQFKTKTFWKNVTALGDSGTVETNTRYSTYGVPGSLLTETMRAPAASVSAVDIIQLPKA